MKAKKAVKAILISILSLVIAAAIVLGGTMFFYYPHYRKNRTQLDVASPAEGEIRVMSCNVRCINPLDFGKKNWFYRADLLLKGIENYYPAIIGFQEVTKWQYNFLTSSLPQYDSVITYRDKAFNSEGCPVFYRTDLYNLVDKGSFWLSETPEEMSKDWGAACYRICSYTILEDKVSSKQFVVFNTHLDHVSDEARIKGIGVVLDKIRQFGSLPCVIMGDFNCREDSETYASATSSFLDAKYQTDDAVIGATYQNWGTVLGGENIDYFMISRTGFAVKQYRVVSDIYDGVCASDHFQIFTSLEFAEE